MKRKRLLRLFNVLTILALILSLLSPAVSAQEVNRNAKHEPNAEARLAEMKRLVQKQTNAFNTGQILHATLENVNDNEWVEVIVQFSEDPVALAKGKKDIQGKTFTKAEAKQVEKKVIDQHKNFEKQLKALNIQYEKGYEFNKVLNGVALKVKGKDLDKIAQLDGVVRVDPNEERYALEVEQSGEVGAMMDRTNDVLNIPE